MIDSRDLKYGFWVGTGFLLAFAAWHLATSLLHRAADHG